MQGKWLFLLPSVLGAVTYNWVGGNAGNWSTAADWQPASVPAVASTTIVTFLNGPPALSSIATVTMDVAPTIGTMQFDNAFGYTIVTPTGAGAQTLTLSSSTGTAQLLVTTSNGQGAHTIGGVDASKPVVVFSSPLLVTQNSSGSFTIAGSLQESGVQTLTKAGSGALVLSGGNTYSGGTRINAGSVVAVSDSDNQLGSGTVTIGGATVVYTTTAGVTTSKPFVLVGTAAVQNGSSGSITLSGVVSGTGALQKTGAGTLSLTGANTYSGGTSVNAGTLLVASDGNLGVATSSLQVNNATFAISSGITTGRSVAFTGSSGLFLGGNVATFTGTMSGSGALLVLGGGTATVTGMDTYAGTVTIAASTALAFNQSISSTVSSPFSGSGTLVQAGSGILTLTGSSNFTGTTFVSAGSLIVNGALGSSSMSVASGATLGGGGSVGTLTSSGTVAPGTMTVNGSATLNSAGTLLVNVYPTSSNLLAVTGATTLGGTLSVEVTPGFYGANATYTLLTSSALGGTFSSLMLSSADFVGTVSFVSNQVQLQLVALHPFAAFPFSNGNTAAVGNNLDLLYSDGELTPELTAVLNSFVGESNATINAALDEMHSAPYSAFGELQVEVDAQILSLFHRLPTLSCNHFAPWRFWLEPFGNQLKIKNDGEQVGFKGTSGGIASGFDVGNDNWAFGFGGAWNQNHLTWKDERGNGRSNGFYGGLYWDYISWQQLYVGASILAGMDFYKTRRNINFEDETAAADFNALDIMAGIRVAPLFGSPPFYFYPYANLDFLYLNTGKIEEEDAPGLNLMVQKRSIETLRTEVGLAFEWQDTNRDETLCLTPKCSVGYINIAPLQRPGFTTTFEGVNVPFSVYGWDQSWNLITFDLGLKIGGETFSLGADYSFETSWDAASTYTNQHANVNLTWVW